MSLRKHITPEEYEHVRALPECTRVRLKKAYRPTKTYAPLCNIRIRKGETGFITYKEHFIDSHRTYATTEPHVGLDRFMITLSIMGGFFDQYEVIPNVAP